MKFNNLKGSAILILAALIWGLGFVAQSGAAELVPPFIFNALRSFIGAAAIYLFYILTNVKRKEPFFPKEKAIRKDYYKAAIICGVCLAISSNLQQFGIAFYPKGAAVEARSGFITALYVILVPIFSMATKKKPGIFVWLGVIISMAGVYMLCFSSGFGGVYFADLLIFMCAVSFSLHIMAVDKFVGFTGGIKLSAMQFAVAGVVSLIFALIFEPAQISVSNIFAASPQILYLGLMSSGVAFTLQIVGQKYAEPAVASISMSLESVFAALGGVVIAGNFLSAKETIGCALVFAATVVAQLSDFKKQKA